MHGLSNYNLGPDSGHTGQVNFGDGRGFCDHEGDL